MSFTELPIGATFEESGTTLLVVEAHACYIDNPSKMPCAFDRVMSGCLDRICRKSQRSDQTAVIFVPRDKYLAARLAGEIT